MHAEALSWLAGRLADVGPVGSCVDVGGRDINGSVRHLVQAERYTCVDLVDGRGVDVVADITDWSPPGPVDLVVCAEVLEHAPDPEGVVAACRRILRPGGVLLLTAAAPPRAPHSAMDGGPLRDGEHYGNVDPDDLRSWLSGWDSEVVYDPRHGDVYARAVKPQASRKRGKT